MPALMLRADLLERGDELPAALALVEQVLARDIDWPGARERHARWRDALGLRTRRSEPRGPPAGMLGDRARRPLPLAPRGGTRRVGAVYEAEDRELLRRVALKVYHRPGPRPGQAPARGARRRRRGRRGDRARSSTSIRERGWLAMEWAPLGRARLRSARSARPSALGAPARPRARARARRRLGPPRREAGQRAPPRAGRSDARRLRDGAPRGRAEPPRKPRLRLSRAPRRARERSRATTSTGSAASSPRCSTSRPHGGRAGRREVDGADARGARSPPHARARTTSRPRDGADARAANRSSARPAS